MKTKKQVLTENESRRILINAVLSRIDRESINDVINHGAQVGFSGFIYYSDTVPFAHRYQKHIVSLLEDEAESMGEDVVAMVSNFGMFRKNPMDAEDKRELYRYLSGAKCKETTIPNLMAWFALEEVCRMFDE